MEMERFNPKMCASLEMDRVVLRMSHEVKEELARMAQNQNISLNTLVIRCIDYAMRNQVQSLM